MLLPIVGLIAGLIVLSYAADQFVIGAARLATAWRMSSVMIGAVVIGFGTSTPELLASGIAAGQGAMDIAVGNIVGSNVANLTLVLGCAALITPVWASSSILRREAPLSAALVLLLTLFIFTSLHVAAAVVLTAGLVASLIIIIKASRNGHSALDAQVVESVRTRAPDTRREGIRTLVGLGATLGAAKVLIDSAVAIADAFGWSQGFVGLTVVAIGTSLPELATAVQAARRKETDLIIGNLLGSNLFNSGAVGAIVAAVSDGAAIDLVALGPATIVMAVVSAIAMVFMATGTKVVRWEGWLLLVGYLAALPFLAP